MRTIVIMGAGGRAFHDFDAVFRDDPEARVAAFTAARIPDLAGRVYPASLAGPRYPDGIPIRPEDELESLVHVEGADEVVLSASGLSHEEVMHRASRALAAGAGFRLLDPRETMLSCRLPVIAVTAVRTGCGASGTSRRVAGLLSGSGLRVALVRHPRPDGDLERMRVRRFASLAELDASRPAVEEREGIEPPRAPGLAVFAGVDTAAVLAAAEREADVLVWDGDDDLPFVRPGLHVVVVDPLRPGHELAYHPGEANLRLADVVVVSRVDAADPADVERVLASVRGASPRATVVLAESPVTLEPGPPLEGRRVLVVEDGPPLTRGGMPFGAGTVAARAAGAELVDPRPWAVGSVAETLAACPWIGAALPAAGYGPAQLADLERTIDAVDCDVVVAGTPVDLARLVRTRHPIRRARSELRERGRPTLHEAIAPIERLAHTELGVSTG